MIVLSSAPFVLQEGIRRRLTRQPDLQVKKPVRSSDTLLLPTDDQKYDHDSDSGDGDAGASHVSACLSDCHYRYHPGAHALPFEDERQIDFSSPFSSKGSHWNSDGNNPDPPSDPVERRP